MIRRRVPAMVALLIFALPCSVAGAAGDHRLSQAPVVIDYDREAAGAIPEGGTGKVRITFTTPTGIDRLRITVRPYEGTRLSPEIEEISEVVEHLTPRTAHAIDVVVTLTAARGYLSVFAGAQTAAGTQTRAVAIPIGARPPPAAGAAETAPIAVQGQRLRLMPARIRE